MRVTPREILGRDAELAEIERFLGSVGAGPSTLILEGAAGIGKTTLWDAGVALASAGGTSGALVSTRRSGGAALVHGPGGSARPRASPASRAAGASSRRSTPPRQVGGTSPDRRADSLAKSVLARSRHPPVTIAIVDTVAGCALRPRAVVRGSPSPRRTDRASCSPYDRDTTSNGSASVTTTASTERLRDPPASARGRCSVSCGTASETTWAIPSCSGCIGPLRATRSSHWRSPVPWPIASIPSEPGEPAARSRRPAAAVASASRNAPASAVEALVAAAAATRPTMELVVGSAGDPDHALAGIAEAEEADIIRVDGERIDFPTRSWGRPSTLRRPRGPGAGSMARLAELVVDPEERARHLALAAPGPEPAVVVAIDSCVAPVGTGRSDAASEIGAGAEGVDSGISQLGEAERRRRRLSVRCGRRDARLLVARGGHRGRRSRPRTGRDDLPARRDQLAGPRTRRSVCSRRSRTPRVTRGSLQGRRACRGDRHRRGDLGEAAAQAQAGANTAIG